MDSQPQTQNPLMDWETYLATTSQLLKLPLSEKTKPGIIANLEATQKIAQPLLEFEIPQHVESSAIFRP